MIKFNYQEFINYVLMKKSMFDNYLAEKSLSQSPELDALLKSKRFLEIGTLSEEEQIKLLQDISKASEGVDLGLTKEFLVQNLSISPTEVEQFILK